MVMNLNCAKFRKQADSETTKDLNEAKNATTPLSVSSPAIKWSTIECFYDPCNPETYCYFKRENAIPFNEGFNTGLSLVTGNNTYREYNTIPFTTDFPNEFMFHLRNRHTFSCADLYGYTYYGCITDSENNLQNFTINLETNCLQNFGMYAIVTGNYYIKSDEDFWDWGCSVGSNGCLIKPVRKFDSSGAHCTYWCYNKENQPDWPEGKCGWTIAQCGNTINDLCSNLDDLNCNTVTQGFRKQWGRSYGPDYWTNLGCTNVCAWFEATMYVGIKEFDDEWNLVRSCNLLVATGCKEVTGSILDTLDFRLTVIKRVTEGLYETDRRY